MTTIAAPSRRARSTATRAPSRVRRAPARAKVKAEPRAAAHSFGIGRLGGLLAVVTIFALVTAVVFHVVLAQNQMELDRVNQQIATEQRTFAHRSLTAATLASPDRLIQEAMRLGLVEPAEAAEYLYVPNAPMPETNAGSTDDTLADWSKTKPSLGSPQP